MKSMIIKIETMQGLEAIRTAKYNDVQQEVIASVVRLGQKVAIYVTEVDTSTGGKEYKVLDGVLRVKGCSERAQDTIEVIVKEKDEKANAKDAYTMNVIRHEPSAVKKAKWFEKATEDLEDTTLDETCTDLNIEISDAAMKGSKAQKSKLKKINTLPSKIKSRLDYNRCPLNTCYELAKYFDDGTLNEVQIKNMIDEITKKSLSEGKSKVYIRAFIENLKIEVELYDSTKIFEKVKSESSSSFEIKRNEIVINVSKHFQSEDFKLKDITDEDRKMIGQFVNKIFDCLKVNHLNKDKAANNRSEDNNNQMLVKNEGVA